MTISSCVTALQTAAATAVTAKVKYTAMPTQPPSRLPAIVTRWTGTTPDANHYGKAARAGKTHTHSVQLVVIVSQAGNTPAEDLTLQTLAETLIVAFDADSTLSGACSFVQLGQVSPDLISWDNNTFATLGVSVEITERI